MTTTTDEILQLASADPERALQQAQSLADEGAGATASERAAIFRAMSVAKRVLGRFEEAVELAERSEASAAEAGDTEQQLLAIVTMVGPLVVLGQSDKAMELIDASAHLATTPYLESRLVYQTGVVWGLRGEPARAIEAFESALPAFRAAGDPEMIRSTLQGLGLYRLRTGELTKAEHDLEEALEIAVGRQEEPIVSGLKHNLGLLASYRGDIIEALRLLLESDEIYMRLTGSSAPQHVTRCEVLLSAGLFHEAHQLAVEIAAQHRASGDPEHLAHALLVAGRAALLAGDLDVALATAEDAAHRYEDRQIFGYALEARRIVIEARYGMEGASVDLMKEARDVAFALESEQQKVSAAQARLLVGRIAVDLGDVDVAVLSLEPVAKIGSAPVELRVESQLATARLRRLRGDRRGADSAARAGLRLLDDYQSALGATDLRMGIEQHGLELGQIGLDLALDSGDPRRILHWMERTRARALRHRPVVAKDDDEIGEALARLRQIEAALREDRGDSQLERERGRLQERIRTADRLKRADAKPDQDFEVGALVTQVGERSLLEIGIHKGRLIGVVVSGGRVRRAELGDLTTTMRELNHVRFAMRRGARRGRGAEAQSLESLDRSLLSNIALDADRVILVPPPSLMAAPWAAFPSLRDTVLTVSPSAEMWWRSDRNMGTGHTIVVAGGPDLDYASAEVSEIGRLYDRARVFPPGATVDEVKESMSGAAIAHIACHATFHRENPMFSSLRLGDGDLNVYDIERLKAPPSMVVLSACDSGYTEAREGVELAGLTSALLTMGTRSVVASVGLVPDATATSDLMIDFHRGMIEGLDPARALSRAQSAAFEDPERFVAAASFVCVGG